MDWWHVGYALFAIILGYWFSSWLWCMRKKKTQKNCSPRGSSAQIPNGRVGLPLIGETFEFIASNYTTTHVDFMQKRRALYGKVFRSHILGRPIIMSTDPEVNRVVLQNDGRTFVPFYPKSVIELLGKTSILQMNGDLHKKFHSLIARFLKSTLLLERITKDIEKSLELAILSWRDKQLIYIQDETNQITFEILVIVLLGISPGREMDLLKREFAEVMKGIICLPIKFPGTRLHKSLKAKERMVKLIKEIIKDKVERGEHEAMAYVVDVLINEFYVASDQQTIELICGIIIEMMIPGQDSVPMLTTVAIKYLTDSPSALKQLLEENMELKRKKNQVGDGYTWSDYMSLPFTQNVINEALRMTNIVNAVWRKSLKDVEIKGYLIPKGWCVMASFSSIHFDEEIYENPFEFNPWRWEGKGGINQSTFSFTPFGGGQRLCPGYILTRLEVSIFLHHFITSFSWVAEDDTIITFPTVKMKKRLPVKLSPISI